MHIYTAYGLTIASELDLPELVPFPESGEHPIDVHIRFGVVPDSLEKPRVSGVLYQASPGLFLLQVPGIARYLVRAGEKITIDAFSGYHVSDIRLFLLHSVFAALLHQRGLLVLHGSSVVTPQGAFVFLGRSASGKSSLAAVLYQRGWAVLSDEICAITLGANGMLVAPPGFPQVCLWADTLSALHLDAADLSPLRPGLDKYTISVVQRFPEEPVPIRNFYLLASHQLHEFDIEPVTGQARFQMIRDQTFFPAFVDGLGVNAAHFRLAATASRYSDFYQIHYPGHLFQLNDLADHIEQDLLA